MIAVDLFAGAGGWTTGAEQAGVHVAAAINHDPLAVRTHAANHPRTHHVCQDAALMDPRDLPAHDLLLASPACQGHSRARGTDKPHHDASRATAWCVVNTLEVCRPRYVAIENVTGFLEWPLYKHWRAALSALGYRLAEHVLDAADFGVPQNRERLFILGERDAARPPHVTAPKRAHVAARTILARDAAWSPVAGHCANTLRRIAASRARFGDEFVVAYYGSAEVGRSLDRPLGTVTTRDRYAHVRGDEMRMLGVDEYRRAMGFPDEYVLEGTRRERVHLLGNAVAPPVAREVVAQLLGASRAEVAA